MHWASPNLSYLLGVPVAAGLILAWGIRRRRKLLQRLVNAAVIAKVTRGFQPGAYRTKALLLVIGLVLLAVALLRPQWGFEWYEVRQEGIDILVAVDVSKSMLTRDVLPDRLSRAKLALEELVRTLRGDRIGLVAFAGEAFLQCPLTIDYDGFLLSVRDLDTMTIPRPGTNIARAIDLARERFTKGSEGADKALIIITDGESHEGDAVAAARRANEEQIKIYTIGVGTGEGELIRIIDEDGTGRFLKDAQGQVVKSRLQEAGLKEIAQASNGTYLKATPTQFGLDVIYEQKIGALEKKQGEAEREKRFSERFQIPLAAALFLLMLEALRGTKKVGPHAKL